MQTILQVTKENLSSLECHQVTEVLVIFDSKFKKGDKLTIVESGDSEQLGKCEVVIDQIKENYAGGVKVKYLNLFLVLVQ